MRVMVAAVLLSLAACATAEPEMIIGGPRSFVTAAHAQAQACGYKSIRRVVRAAGEKLAESELERTSPQAECFGEWIAKIPDATFAVAAPSVVF